MLLGHVGFRDVIGCEGRKGYLSFGGAWTGRDVLCSLRGSRFLVWGWFEVFRVIVEILCGGIIKTIGLRFFMLFCKVYMRVL